MHGELLVQADPIDVVTRGEATPAKAAHPKRGSGGVWLPRYHPRRLGLSRLLPRRRILAGHVAGSRSGVVE